MKVCANGIISNVDVNSLTLIIDDVPSNKLVKQVQSGPGGFQLSVAPNNPFGVPSDMPISQPTITLSVSDGYWALVPANSLTPGAHTITFGGTANFPDSSSFRTPVTYHIVVV
jgi:hypothetical protein